MTEDEDMQLEKIRVRRAEVRSEILRLLDELEQLSIQQHYYTELGLHMAATKGRILQTKK
jgi:hypothetical protein